MALFAGGLVEVFGQNLFTILVAGRSLFEVDATAIARSNDLGTRSVPIVNTALAGAVGRMLGFSLQEMCAALEHLGFTGPNLLAATTAYEEVLLLDLEGFVRGLTEPS